MSHIATHYIPEFPPIDNELSDWVRRELEKIAEILEAPDIPLYTEAPAKPRDGQLVRADGVLWNPGSGRGLYIYDQASWKLVKTL